jgi:hypothetical protein
MTKTLADLTPQDLANHVGTWVDVPHKPHPVIYMGDFESTGEIKYGAVILDPRYGTNYEHLEDCTPRPDLPRAWQADGTPVRMDVQIAEYRPSVNRGFYITRKTTEKGPELPEGTTHAQRWVGEWEEA